MSKKKTFVTLEQLKEIDKTYPTPYHLYDEKGIRENAKRLKEAFSWNKGEREYFAVKATPNPEILKILKAVSYTHLDVYKRQELVVYGNVPLMVSEQCVRRTYGRCDGNWGSINITGPKGSSYTVESMCEQMCIRDRDYTMDYDAKEVQCTDNTFAVTKGGESCGG